MKKNSSVAFKIDIMLVAQNPPFLSEETDAQEGLGGDDLPQGSRVQPQDHPPIPSLPHAPWLSAAGRWSRAPSGTCPAQARRAGPGSGRPSGPPGSQRHLCQAQASAGTNLLCWASSLTLCPLCPTQPGNGLWALILGPAVAGRIQGFTELGVGSHARDLGTSSYLLHATPVVVTGWLGRPIVVWEMFWNQPFNENKRN